MKKQTHFISQSVTYKNNYYIDKPNEDYIIADDSKGIYILLDGVSVDRKNDKYPCPSPALKASTIFATTVYKYLIKEKEDNDYISSIKLSIKEGNKMLYYFNKKNKYPVPAGTVGIISIIKEYYLYYAYIGDCFGRIISENNIYTFTKEQTYLVRIHKNELTKNEIRLSICNNIHHPYGYGVYNGSKNALDFVTTGEIFLHKNDIILLNSDGYEPYLTKLSYTFSKDIFTCASPSVIGDRKTDDRSLILIKENI